MHPELQQFLDRFEVIQDFLAGCGKTSGHGHFRGEIETSRLRLETFTLKSLQVNRAPQVHGRPSMTRPTAD
jgi:hypothetical protein